MKSINVCFKKVLYGDDKDTILAVLLDERLFDVVYCFSLFGGSSSRLVQEIKSSCSNANAKEYLSTMTALKKEYPNSKINVKRNLKS